MQKSRRDFLRSGSQLGVLASTSLLWTHPLSALQLAAGTDYRAIVVITLNGGNDGNNTLIPLDPASYEAYVRLRQSLALAKSTLLPLKQGVGSAHYGLHPSLVNIASLYNSNQALILANIGPIVRPSTKQDILANQEAYPGGKRSHPVALGQWQSGQVNGSGWGGRVADYLTSSSGALPPVLTTVNSLFSVGSTVQAVAIQGGSAYAALPPLLTDAVARIAQVNALSKNLIVQQVAALKSRASGSQQLLNRAIAYDQLKTPFGTSPLQTGLKTIAQLVAGRSVVGATRQIFYVEQMGYDTHEQQFQQQANQLTDLDQGIGSFMHALDELGMRDKVIVCTHSDFCRTLQPNTTGGTDHAWGNHHFMIGGCLSGGRIVGRFPEMEVGGASDISDSGVWIPTQSVTQMTAGLAGWLGLSPKQVSTVFPDLTNFKEGPTQLLVG